MPRCVLIHRIDLNSKFITLIIKSKWLGESFSNSFLNVFQFTSRRDIYNVKSVAARNEYLLHIAAANAHQSRYYKTDLTQLMKVYSILQDISKSAPEGKTRYYNTYLN